MRRPQRDNAASIRKISRRGLIVGGGQVAVAALLGYRMQSLQVEQADQFRLLAEENRINIHLIPPARGLIFDREGRPLAENEQNYRVVLRREAAGDVAQALEKLRQIMELPGAG